MSSEPKPKVSRAAVPLDVRDVSLLGVPRKPGKPHDERNKGRARNSTTLGKDELLLAKLNIAAAACDEQEKRWSLSLLIQRMYDFECKMRQQQDDNALALEAFDWKCRDIDNGSLSTQQHFFELLAAVVEMSARPRPTPNEMIRCSLLDFLHLFDESIHEAVLARLAHFREGLRQRTYRTLMRAAEARNRTREARQRRGDADVVVSALAGSPISVIGGFPHHLDAVTRMVMTARSSLHIMADCVDYGAFSHPELHYHMNRALHDACKAGVDIDMLITEAPAAISGVSPFHGRNYQDLLDDQTFCETLDTFLNFNLLAQRPSSEAEFVAVLQSQQEKIRHDLRSTGIEIYDLAGRPVDTCPIADTLVSIGGPAPVVRPHKADLFFWVVDGREAIFVLSNTAPSGWKIALHTDAPQLLGLLNSVFLKHWKIPFDEHGETDTVGLA